MKKYRLTAYTEHLTHNYEQTLSEDFDEYDDAEDRMWHLLWNITDNHFSYTMSELPLTRHEHEKRNIEYGDKLRTTFTISEVV